MSKNSMFKVGYVISFTTFLCLFVCQFMYYFSPNKEEHIFRHSLKIIFLHRFCDTEEQNDGSYIACENE